MGVFDLQYNLISAVYVALLLVKAFAFVDALTRRPDAFPAADKMTKVAWLWITGLSLAAELVLPGPIGLISLIGTVASFVYILDVRPAVTAVTRR